MIGRAAEGGVVFFAYLSGDVVHGLVAATADEPGGAVYSQAAAITCAAKSENGYTDWFLPNKAQITALFNNRFAINPNDFNGGFSNTGDARLYLSSSPTGIVNNVWVQDFAFGNQPTSAAFGASTRFSARCVRAF